MECEKTASFWKVFLLSIITLSIYLWIYLFRCVRQIESAFGFNQNEFQPQSARSALIFALCLDILSAVATMMLWVSYSASPEGRYAMQTGNVASLPNWLSTAQIITNIMFTGAWVLKWSFFFTLIKRVRPKAGIALPMGNAAWILIAAYAAGLVFSLLIPPVAILCSLTMVGMAIAMIALAVHEMNKLWLGAAPAQQAVAASVPQKQMAFNKPTSSSAQYATSENSELRKGFESMHKEVVIPEDNIDGEKPIADES